VIARLTLRQAGFGWLLDSQHRTPFLPLWAAPIRDEGGLRARLSRRLRVAMSSRPKLSSFWVAVGLFALVSCTGSDGALQVSCEDTILSRQTDITCYTVTVPADHSEPDADTLELFVVVLDNPEGDEIGPVAYLEGGPGYAAHSRVDEMRGKPFDVVLVDQRGTGLSKPFLGCPEVDEVIPLLVALGGPAEAEALVADAYADCGARLANEGVDVSWFDTESNARDFDIVRTALGYDQWNLRGSSYGSRLGLEILRLHSESVRAAVFDAVQAPQADLLADWPDHFRDAVDLLAESCAASRACYDAYGDISAVHDELVAQLDAEPVDVEVRGTTVRMDGAALVTTVRDALSETETLHRIPFLLTAAANGDLIPLAEIRAERWGQPDPTFSAGMHLSVQCRDHYSATDQDAIAAALVDETGGFAEALDFTREVEKCAAWGAGTSPSSTREPVASDVPTLLMAGTFDPLSPPEWTQLVVHVLANSTYIEFARYGHDLRLCGDTAAENFLRNPTRAPDMLCDPSDPPRWLVP
jgi:pimeloyl-ACP methyl ester carboxylesterase